VRHGREGIVREGATSSQRYDPVTDLIVLVSSPSDSAAELRSVLLNGRLSPAPLELRVGVSYRVRSINITKARPGMRLELLGPSGIVAWRVIAKDGPDLSAARAGGRRNFVGRDGGADSRLIQGPRRIGLPG